MMSLTLMSTSLNFLETLMHLFFIHAWFSIYCLESTMFFFQLMVTKSEHKVISMPKTHI